MEAKIYERQFHFNEIAKTAINKDQRIEISHDCKASKTFRPDEFELANNWIEDGQAQKKNIYIAPAIRHPHIKGRADKNGVAHSGYAWADADDRDAVDCILELQPPQEPSFIIQTGTVPHLRLHAYWRADLTVRQIENANKQIIDRLGTDRACFNQDRLMRMAGTRSYPPQSKLDRGYIEEDVVIYVNWRNNDR